MIRVLLLIMLLVATTVYAGVINLGSTLTLGATVNVGTGAAPSTDKMLLDDGSSFVLLDDGASRILLP